MGQVFDRLEALIAGIRGQVWVEANQAELRHNLCELLEVIPTEGRASDLVHSLWDWAAMLGRPDMLQAIPGRTDDVRLFMLSDLVRLRMLLTR